MSSVDRESRQRRRGQRGFITTMCSEETLRDQYEVLGVIGRGSFAQVILAIHRLTGILVVLKVLSKVAGILETIETEVELMKRVQHCNVVQLFQVMETMDYVYLVMEVALGGQILWHIPRDRGLEEQEARRTFRQVVCALHYCHEQGVVHRDVKVENILLDKAGNIKLCDFGLGSRFRAGQKLSGACGTPEYCAPELYEGEEYDGPAADAWSLGVTLFYMLAGRLPFDGETVPELAEKILDATYDMPAHVSAEAQSLIRQLLVVDPAERATLPQILEHPWLGQEQENSPGHPRQPLPNLPNPTVLGMMVELGFHIKEVCLSLSEKTYDHGMATYLLLQSLLTPGSGFKVDVQVAHPKLRPHLCPAPPPPNRRASDPALGSVPFLPSSPQLAEDEQASGRNRGRGASLPAIALGSLKRTPPTAPCDGPQHDPEPPTPSPCISGPVDEPESSKSHPTAPCDGPQHDPEPPLPSSRNSGPLDEPGHSKSPGDTAACGPGNRRGWRKATRAIADWLLKCCCLAAPCTGPPAFRNTVSPGKAGQKRRRFFRRVAPIKTPDL